MCLWVPSTGFWKPGTFWEIWATWPLFRLYTSWGLITLSASLSCPWHLQGKAGEYHRNTSKERLVENKTFHFWKKFEQPARHGELSFGESHLEFTKYKTIFGKEKSPSLTRVPPWPLPKNKPKKHHTSMIDTILLQFISAEIGGSSDL